MVIREIKTLEEVQYAHSYSDIRKMIQKVGTQEIYSEAYDPAELSSVRTYIETDIDIPTPDLSADLSGMEQLDVIN